MKRNYIARRFQLGGTGLSLDTEALSKYKDIIDLSNGDTECNMVQNIEIRCPSLDDVVGMFGVCRTVKEFCACAWYGDTMPRRVACEVIDPEEDDCGGVPDKRIFLKVTGARF